MTWHLLLFAMPPTIGKSMITCKECRKIWARSSSKYFLKRLRSHAKHTYKMMGLELQTTTPSSLIMARLLPMKLKTTNNEWNKHGTLPLPLNVSLCTMRMCMSSQSEQNIHCPIKIDYLPALSTSLILNNLLKIIHNGCLRRLHIAKHEFSSKHTGLIATTFMNKLRGQHIRLMLKVPYS